MLPFTQQWPRNHHDLVQHYNAQYDERVRSGEMQPFLYPWGTFGALVVIIYLLIPHQHRPWLRKARFLVFAWITGFAAYSIVYTQARITAAAFGVGLVSAWSVIWILTIMVINDAETDYQRIERTEGVFKGSSNKTLVKNGTNDTRQKDEAKVDNSVDKTTLNGHGRPHEHLGPSKRHGEFAWQPYPITPFVERLDWVLDVFCNFRGSGWNWRTTSIPPPPKVIQGQVYHNSPHPPAHSVRVYPGQPHLYTTRRELLVGNLHTFASGYLILDLLKTLINHDPYFWGVMDRGPPSYFPSFIANNAVLLRMYRLTLSQFAVMWALKFIFSLGPLFFSGLLGPSILGARAEPWMYPDTWGPYSMVLDHGLAAWWGGWWHQTFRYAFEQPGRKLVQLLGLKPKSPSAKLIQLVTAFGLSGFLHACGSYTCAGSTRPLLGPMRFFLLQAFGCFIEAILIQPLLKSSRIEQNVPRWLMRAITFSYVHLWFYHTASLICDDFAKGGIWLFEPIPISPLRGLGFGVEGDGWWCWNEQKIWWHKGDRWWRSGIAL